MENKKSIEIFRDSCKELFELGELEIFSLVMFPLKTVEAKVKEHIIEEYNSLELVILRLVGVGVKRIDLLHQMTGLKERTIKKILNNEIEVYQHIDNRTMELTIAGKETLKENEGAKSDENLRKHEHFITVREFQVDATTATVMMPEYKAKDIGAFKNAYDEIEGVYTILSGFAQMPVEKKVEEEIKRGLYQYHPDYLNDSDTIEDILNMYVTNSEYCFGYLASFKKQDPILVTRGYMYNKDEKKNKVVYYPTCISEKMNDEIQRKGLQKSYDYVIKGIESFEILERAREYIRNNVVDKRDLEEIMRNHAKEANGGKGNGIQ